MRARILALTFLIGCPGSDPLAITSSTLPVAVVGQDYTFQLTATGGDGSYSWSMADALPAGFVLSQEGAINGRGTAPGTFSFIVRVLSGEEQADRTLSLTIELPPPAKLEIITEDLLQARVGEPYDRAIAARGGTREYAWSVLGTLPPGIDISSTGYPATELAGTPSQEGSYTFTVMLADGAGMTASKEYTLIVQPDIPPQFDIRSFLLPDGVVGSPYSAALQVENASGTVAWSVATGDFPPGLILDETGDPHTTVTGTPTVAGEFNFVLRATDDDGDTDTQAYNVTISPTFVPIEIETLAVPTATVGIPVNFLIVARYGTGLNFTWSVTGGQLPPGLMLAPDGTPAVLINGTAGMRGTWTATITVQDSNGDMASREFDFVVEDPRLFIATTLLPGGDLQLAYYETILAAGGSGSGHSWRVSAGALPPGLTLQPSISDSVTLDGVPTTLGSYDFTIEVMDDAGQIATRDYTVPIYAPVEIITESLPAAEAGAAYSATLAAQGGSGGYTYQISGGALPPGLTLASGGTISGIATTLGDYSFTVTARDSRSRSGSRTLAIAVFSPVSLTILTQALDGAGSGQAYSATITAAGGTGTGYMWSVENGTLPQGLGLTPNATPTASITGATNALGSHTFTLRVTDSAGGTFARAFTIQVLPALQITTVSLPSRIECASQFDMLTASGGSGSGYSWSLRSGAPPGVSIDASGTPSTTLRGRPTAPGSYSTTIRVRDSAGLINERTFSIGVDADPSAQHWAILVGDLATEGDTEVLLTNVCGDQGFGLTPMNPSAPGTGDASLDPSDAAFSPDLARVGFVGDFMIDGTEELFISTAADPTQRRRISGPMVAGGDVSAFFWSPDSTLIAYIADQTTDGVDELFVVDVSNPAMPFFPVLASAPLTGNSDVAHVSWAPDSNGLIYRADPTDTVFELFWVNLTVPTAPAAPVRLHAPLTAPRSCDGDFDWAPAGNAVVYRCDAANAGVFELWYVRFMFGAPQPAQRTNGALVANGDVVAGSFAFSPDGSGVAYLADQNTDEVVEVYIAVTFGGIVPGVRAMAPLAANEDVTGFRFGPAGFRGLVRGDLDADEVFELYLLDAAGGLPANVLRINAAMAAGGDVDAEDFAFSPDGDRVAYLADQNVNDHPELFISDVTGALPGAPVRASPVLGAAAGTSVDSFAFTADSLRIAMLGDFVLANQIELAASNVAAPSPQILNLPLPSGGDVLQFYWRSSGDGIFFSADMIANDDVEGWSVDLSAAAPATPNRLHPPLAGADLEFFWIEP